MTKEERVKLGFLNKEFGEFCEQLAADHFIKQGYTIRARNWKFYNVEIDLILEKDRTIIFVEVKGRLGNNQDPVDAVDSKKRQKMIKAADVYMGMLTLLYQYRFDIVTVTGTKEKYEFKHYEDAFLPSVNGGSFR